MDLPSFRHANVVVMGDLMLDKYWYGDARRVSPEAPVPVVNVDKYDIRPGGAGNVAMNIKSLGAEVSLLGLTGQDDAQHLIASYMDDLGVRHCFQKVENHPTTTKLRVISHNQQLIRLDFESSFEGIDKSELVEAYRGQIKHANVIVLSDYMKGCLSDIQLLIRLAKEANIPVLIDPKGRNFEIYQGATLLTPNINEFESIVGSCSSQEILEQKAVALIEDLNLEALLVTRGSDGMSLISPQHPPLHLPAKAREVFDVTGAGDTVIAVTAAALAAGCLLQEAVTLANYAAGVVVGRVGAACVNVVELNQALAVDRESIVSLESILDDHSISDYVALHDSNSLCVCPLNSATIDGRLVRRLESLKASYPHLILALDERTFSGPELEDGILLFKHFDAIDKLWLTKLNQVERFCKQQGVACCYENPIESSKIAEAVI